MSDALLTRDRLPTAEAVFTLGLLVVRSLQTDGMVVLFINRDGEVEVCPWHEISLDGSPEERALEALLERGYTDDQLTAYLKGRKARMTSEPKHERDLRSLSV